jgi:hypothetical protein
MAKLYRSNGTVEEIRPANGVNFTLGEMQTLVGGYIQIGQTYDGEYMVLDEEGKNKGKPFNLLATRLYRFGHDDLIVGDAIVAQWLEINGPDEPEANEDDDEVTA